MAAAHAAPRCQAWLPAGRRCACPALRGKRRCHFHNRIFKPQRRHYPLPVLEDAASIHLALLQLTRAVAEDGVTPDQARLLLYALQLASANLKHMAPDVASAATAQQPPASQSPGHPTTQSPDHSITQSPDSPSLL